MFACKNERLWVKHERTLVRIRGALTPPPRMDDPVVKIPLQLEFNK